MSINEDGTCKHASGKKCLCKDQAIRGFFGNMNVCSPVAEVLGIEQVHGARAVVPGGKQCQ